MSALFDVGVTREIKVRVPLAFSQKGYASFPLPAPFEAGHWSQWPDNLVRPTSVSPTVPEIELLEGVCLPSAVEAEAVAKMLSRCVGESASARKRKRTAVPEWYEELLKTPVPRFSADHVLGRPAKESR